MWELTPEIVAMLIKQDDVRQTQVVNVEKGNHSICNFIGNVQEQNFARGAKMLAGYQNDRNHTCDACRPTRWD